jgi:hypothetical protein
MTEINASTGQAGQYVQRGADHEQYAAPAQANPALASGLVRYRERDRVIVDQRYGGDFVRRYLFDEGTFRWLGADERFVVGYAFSIPDPAFLSRKMMDNALFMAGEEPLEETLKKAFPDDAGGA